MTDHAKLFRNAKPEIRVQMAEIHDSEGTEYTDLLLIAYDLRSEFAKDLWLAFPTNLPEYFRRLEAAATGDVAAAAAVLPLRSMGLEFVAICWPERPDLIHGIQARDPGAVPVLTVTARDEVLLTFAEIDEWSRN